MIVAVLIVKNESHVLERCLSSILRHVNRVVVYDTGSTKNEDLSMRATISKLRHEWERPIFYIKGEWFGFAESRNKAMEAAIERCELASDKDYIFMIDADDYVTHWEYPPEPEATKHAGFLVTMVGGSITYPRVQLFRPGLWRYRGVVHEFPESEGLGHTVGTLQTTVVSTREGARNNDIYKYRNDAELLEKAIDQTQLMGDDIDLLPRYSFYLAQSYRDAGEDGRASEWYMTRARMEAGYQEERYVSLLENMRLKNTYDGWDDGGYDLKAQLELAQSICPHRRECVRAMAVWLTDIKAWRDVIDLLTIYSPVAEKPNGLFIEDNAYGYHLYDILGVAYYWHGDYRASLDASLTALKLLPELSVDTKRLVANMDFALKHLP